MTCLALHAACCSNAPKPCAGQPDGVRCAAQVLVEKARVEAEEAQRILLAALNGLAGLMILDSDRPQAVALYRKVTIGLEHARQ